MYAFISGFNCFIGLYVSTNNNSFHFCNFETSFEIEKCDSSNFVLFFQEIFGYSVLLQYHMNLRIVFSISVKRPLIFQERLNLFSRSFSMILKILTISCLPIHECGMSFHLGRSFLNSFSNVLYFSVYKSLHPGLNLFRGT